MVLTLWGREGRGNSPTCLLKPQINAPKTEMLISPLGELGGASFVISQRGRGFFAALHLADNLLI